MGTISKANIESFIVFLVSRGCHIMPVTNEYELVRFKGYATGVIYNSTKTSGKYADDAVAAFFGKGNKWNTSPNTKKTRRPTGTKRQQLITQVIDRDGDLCFYCFSSLSASSITIEHLVPALSGGKNSFGNIVLCCPECNTQASCRSIVDKIKMRERGAELTKNNQ